MDLGMVEKDINVENVEKNFRIKRLNLGKENQLLRV